MKNEFHVDSIPNQTSVFEVLQPIDAKGMLLILFLAYFISCFCYWVLWWINWFLFLSLWWINWFLWVELCLMILFFEIAVEIIGFWLVCDFLFLFLHFFMFFATFLLINSYKQLCFLYFPTIIYLIDNNRIALVIKWFCVWKMALLSYNWMILL
jgi:hypothetical protein